MVAKKGNGVFILVVSLIVLVGGGVAFFLYRKAKKTQVKDEVTDVIVAAKEVANQAGDVVAAAKGKERKGRKKK